MPAPRVELAWSAFISLVIVALGIYYIAREIRERRRQGYYVHLPPDDRTHFQRQCLRRVIGSGLLIGAGVAILAGQSLLDWQKTPVTYFFLWLGVLLDLFGIICLAGADIVAIRRYARRQSRKLQADRREMIERQLEQYHADRTRPHGLPPDFDVERN